MSEYTRKDWRMAAIVSLILLVLGVCNLTTGIPVWGDDHAAYINEGIAIAEGRFEEQTKINYFYHPSDMPEEASDGRLVYVWGYPLLLSLVYKVVGFDRVNFTSIIWYKIPLLLSLSLTGGVLTLFFRRRFSLYVSAGAAMVFCMSGNLFDAINKLYSDPAFLLFSMLTLLLMEVYTTAITAEKKNKVWIALLYSLSMWMTHETRLSGFTVCIVAALGHGIAVVRKQSSFNRHNWWWYLMPYLLFGAVVLISEHLWLAPATPNISDIGKTTEENIPLIYWRTIFNYFDSLPRLPFVGTGYIFIGACILGIILKGFKENLHLTLLLIGTLVVDLSLPYTQGLRYLYNVLPIMAMFCLYGFQVMGKAVCAIWKGANGTVGRTIAMVCAAEILFFSLSNQVYRAGYNFVHWDERYSYDVYSDDAKEVYQYIWDRVPEDAIIAFGKPRALYLNTGNLGYCVGNNGHKIEDADYYLRLKTSDFDRGKVDVGNAEKILENDSFELYKMGSRNNQGDPPKGDDGI